MHAAFNWSSRLTTIPDSSPSQDTVCILTIRGGASSSATSTVTHSSTWFLLLQNSTWQTRVPRMHIYSVNYFMLSARAVTNCSSIIASPLFQTHKLALRNSAVTFSNLDRFSQSSRSTTVSPLSPRLSDRIALTFNSVEHSSGRVTSWDSMPVCSTTQVDVFTAITSSLVPKWWGQSQDWTFLGNAASH